MTPAKQAHTPGPWKARIVSGSAGDWGEWDIYVGDEGDETFICRSNGGTGADS